MSVYEGFKLILNCDFVAVADRKFCQIFYGKEKLLEEEIAAYSFYDDESFDLALQLARHFSRKPYFEKMWSAKSFDDQPGGYICMKRLEGPTFAKILQDQGRNAQLTLCASLATAIGELHNYGVAHGALEEESILFDPHYRIPVILETITVAFKDQLQSENLAPEQKESEALLPATDVFWFANLYLSKIKRPSRALNKLITACTHADPEQRPKIDQVISELQQISGVEWETSKGISFRPSRIFQAAGVLVLVVASVIAFNFWKSETTIRNENAAIYQEVQSAIAYANALPTTADKIRHLRFEVPKANTVQRSILLEEIGSHLSGKNFPVVTNLNKSLQAVFALSVPMFLTDQGNLGLGSIVEANDAQGYVSEIRRQELFLQTENGFIGLGVDFPYLLSTKRRDVHSNIFIPGGRENMRHILGAVAQFYGYQLIDEGGQDGVLSGYFHYDTIDEFLQSCAAPLNLEIKDKVITVKNTDDLRIYAPIKELPLGQYPNFRELVKFLASPTGYDLVFENLGPLETLDISKMYTDNIAWKDLLHRLGAVYRLENRGGVKTLLISRGEKTP